MVPDCFADLAAFTSLPRVTALAVSPTGRVVVAADAPDEAGAAYVSALWELDPSGASPPRRLTWSDKGESSPVFLPDGTLAFVSSRVDDEAALWTLPPGGEARAVGRYPGGVRGPVTAAAASVVLVSASRPVGADETGDGEEPRRQRKARKVTAILHTGMPIRYWDHELGDVSPRLLAVHPGREHEPPVDLLPGARHELTNAAYDLSADGTVAVVTWRERRRGGRTRQSIAVLDPSAPGTPQRLLRAGDDAGYGSPALAPDGRRVAVVREEEGTFERPMVVGVRILATSGEADREVAVDIGDVFPSELAWTADGSTLLVAGDWHGRGAVLAVEPDSGEVIRRLASDAGYAGVRPSGDGAAVYAIRSAIDSPPHAVRLALDASDQEPEAIAGPGEIRALPGTVHEVTARAGEDAEVRGWLCLPSSGERPAPVMLWVHGGPFSSWNDWSWRWNPWVAVAHGWAVLLPDPALSTGYGPGWWARAWPHRAGLVWKDLEAVLDAALARDDLDGSRVACLGGSFGGYMTNWIAGHTDRFGAIVTHAGLWALDQQHTTTDGAAWKTRLFGTPAEHPDWYDDNSPNRSVDAITTPMLVVHGNRDYRVPVSEALRLWWDLVSRFDGDPDELPHRFLQFTGENHWILSPANAQVWYETVLGFCAEHVLGAEPRRSPLL